ncbi:ferrous iron permease EfeU [Alicyclobacillus contaminans]|uniref:FTR1 family iron permease n=1 Tax=Alicyclobacillus contaminans TaxID=392016 RepID=UPI00042A8F12|nr:FTR1 family protein [Alicyclobacillus contaminans]GMA51455.1 ferrous iron permease EfeU [Alicyclobacillus contaminans]
MIRASRGWLAATLAVLMMVCAPATLAADAGVSEVQQADGYVVSALQQAKQGDLSAAKVSYDQFNTRWFLIETHVQSDSSAAYADIEEKMGNVQYAFMQKNQVAVVQALQQLHTADQRFVQGGYTKGQTGYQSHLTLADFIGKLQTTKQSVQRGDRSAALAEMTDVRQSWLSVEGTVVAQSATVYNDAERDMVVVNAMISSGDENDAVAKLNDMIQYLTPLADKTSYTLWDAAMIPVREGLEALLVVGALLAVVRKSGEGRGSAWIWTGVLAGIACSALLAVMVKWIFSSGAFGQNNFVISGWTGILAAAMLLYMSYWLHRKSNVAEWNAFLRKRSQAALDTGRLISLGALSFLAVFREGTETVLFILGMVNAISWRSLLLGLIMGVAILAVIAFLMLFVGMKLPIRSFFLVSSLVVFYLCFKFTGLGIHSLQLAGTLPSTTVANWPSIAALGFYPSWQSAIPQLLLLAAAVGLLVWRTVRRKRLPVNTAG